MRVRRCCEVLASGDGIYLGLVVSLFASDGLNGLGRGRRAENLGSRERGARNYAQGGYIQYLTSRPYVP